MMNYKGWEIPEGKVVKVEDAAGRVIWMLPSSGKPVILEVEKITSDTYAAETTYTGESFILLDIYPKNANSTVKVTYGGLTKTLAFSGTNAQQVFFGTFNGVADSVETPASGTLTIEGGYVAFACGKHKHNKTFSKMCPCVTAITDWGEVEYIPDQAFSVGASFNHENCYKIASVIIPASVKWIGYEAFSYIADLKEVIMLATTPPQLRASVDTDDDTGITTYVYAFDGLSDWTIIVPDGCGDIYKAAEGWFRYRDKIVEAS